MLDQTPPLEEVLKRQFVLFFYCKNLVAWALVCYRDTKKSPVFLIRLFKNLAKGSNTLKEHSHRNDVKHRSSSTVEKQSGLQSVFKSLLCNQLGPAALSLVFSPQSGIFNLFLFILETSVKHRFIQFCFPLGMRVTMSMFWWLPSFFFFF